MKFYLTRWLLVIGALSGILSCDESLPPQESIPTVMSGATGVRFPGQTVVIRDGAPVGTIGSLIAMVRNIYDEVLEDTATVDVVLTVALVDHPEVHGTVTLGANDVTTWQFFHQNLLTLKVDSTVVLEKQWTHRTDDGTPFWDYVRLTPKFTPAGEPYCASDPVRYRVQGRARLFKYAPAVELTPQEIVITYMIFGITCE
jgi:hypothetical protein